MNPYEAPRHVETRAATMAACAEMLISLGVKPNEAKPPLYRALWRMGFEPRPPLYARMGQLLLLPAAPAGFLWAAYMRLVVWQEMPLAVVVGGGAFFGFFLAGAMGWMARRARAKKGLPPWSELYRLAVANDNPASPS
jgi:hypothetical protein